jgi:Ni,Fe-hydrogenase III small subunit
VTTSRSARATSVWVLLMESGGCGACVQQIYALLGPRYAEQLSARGIALALSPRHADIVLIAGPLSQAAREPVARLLTSVPQPRALVAVGDCAIDGCVFRGSSALVPSAAEALDVNIEIGGCPPTPTAILEAIEKATQVLASDTGAADAEEDQDGSADEIGAEDTDETDGVDDGDDLEKLDEENA